MMSVALNAPGTMNIVATPKVIGDYKIVRTIGRGNFAQVSLAKNAVTESKVAIKVIDKQQIDEENLRKTYREIEIMKRLRHPHIVRLYQVIETDRLICLITEFASGGEIYTYLKKHNKMTERDARRVFRQMTSAVAYCHANGLVHRDLKAENILLGVGLCIKLADFGFSNYYNSGELLKTCCGSPPYAAPELFQGLEYDGFKTDIWSLGVLLYVLVTGGFPFPGSSYENLRIAVLNCRVNIPYFVSVECSDLIRKMLVLDPTRRYTMHQIMQHKWFVAEMDAETASFTQSSLEGREKQPYVQNEPLNETIVWYLQQKGFTKDVKEAVLSKRFDSAYAAYHLLSDHLKRTLNNAGGDFIPLTNGNISSPPNAVIGSISGGMATSPFLDGFDGEDMFVDSGGMVASMPLQPPGIDFARRSITGGAEPRRASITTGLVGSDFGVVAPVEQLSVAEMLALNRPSPPDSIEEYMNAESSGDEDAQQPGQGFSDAQQQHDAALQRYLTQRRHTLGVPSPNPILLQTPAHYGNGGGGVFGGLLHSGSPHAYAATAAAPYPIRQTAGIAGELPNLARQAYLSPQMFMNVHHLQPNPWAQQFANNAAAGIGGFGFNPQHAMFPGQQLMDNAAMASLQQQHAATVFLSPLAGQAHLLLPNWERRASDGACLLSNVVATNSFGGLEHPFVNGKQQHLQSQQQEHPQQKQPRLSFNAEALSNFKASPSSMAEAGDDLSPDQDDVKRYLRSRGKRHTVHSASAGGADSATSPSRDSQQRTPAPFGSSHAAQRFYSSQPYPPAAIGGRRCSDAMVGLAGASAATATAGGGGGMSSGLPSSVLAHLERLHNQAISNMDSITNSSSGNLWQLQQDFSQPKSSSELNQQLQSLQIQSNQAAATANARASPPAMINQAGLHMITEESPVMRSTLADRYGASAGNPFGAMDGVSFLSAGGATPTINVTDERGKTFMASRQLAGSSAFANPQQTTASPFLDHSALPTLLNQIGGPTTTPGGDASAAANNPTPLLFQDPFSFSYQQEAQRILNPTAPVGNAANSNNNNCIRVSDAQFRDMFGATSDMMDHYAGVPVCANSIASLSSSGGSVVPDKIVPVSRTVSMLALDLKRVLHGLNVCYSELPCEEPPAGQPSISGGMQRAWFTFPADLSQLSDQPPPPSGGYHFGAAAANLQRPTASSGRRRLSIEGNNGVKLEIGLAPDPTSFGFGGPGGSGGVATLNGGSGGISGGGGQQQESPASVLDFRLICGSPTQYRKLRDNVLGLLLQDV